MNGLLVVNKVKIMAPDGSSGTVLDPTTQIGGGITEEQVRAIVAEADAGAIHTTGDEAKTGNLAVQGVISGSSVKVGGKDVGTALTGLETGLDTVTGKVTAVEGYGAEIASLKTAVGTVEGKSLAEQVAELKENGVGGGTPPFVPQTFTNTGTVSYRKLTVADFPSAVTVTLSNTDLSMTINGDKIVCKEGDVALVTWGFCVFVKDSKWRVQGDSTSSGTQTSFTITPYAQYGYTVLKSSSSTVQVREMWMIDPTGSGPYVLTEGDGTAPVYAGSDDDLITVYLYGTGTSVLYSRAGHLRASSKESVALIDEVAPNVFRYVFKGSAWNERYPMFTQIVPRSVTSTEDPAAYGRAHPPMTKRFVGVDKTPRDLLYLNTMSAVTNFSARIRTPIGSIIVTAECGSGSLNFPYYTNNYSSWEQPMSGDRIRAGVVTNTDLAILMISPSIDLDWVEVEILTPYPYFVPWWCDECPARYMSVPSPYNPARTAQALIGSFRKTLTSVGSSGPWPMVNLYYTNGYSATEVAVALIVCSTGSALVQLATTDRFYTDLTVTKIAETGDVFGKIELYSSKGNGIDLGVKSVSGTTDITFMVLTSSSPDYIPTSTNSMSSTYTKITVN